VSRIETERNRTRSALSYRALRQGSSQSRTLERLVHSDTANRRLGDVTPGHIVECGQTEGMTKSEVSRPVLPGNKLLLLLPLVAMVTVASMLSADGAVIAGRVAPASPSRVSARQQQQQQQRESSNGDGDNNEQDDNNYGVDYDGGDDDFDDGDEDGDVEELSTANSGKENKRHSMRQSTVYGTRRETNATAQQTTGGGRSSVAAPTENRGHAAGEGDQDVAPDGDSSVAGINREQWIERER
jgi:hypothetical protein